MKDESAKGFDDAVARRNPSLPAATRGAPIVSNEGNRLTEKIATLEAEIALHRQAAQNYRDEMQAFAYSVSHDLRAPLRAIEGFSKILLEDFARDLSPDAQRFLKHIVSNTETLGSQVEDLLRYYRIGKNPPNRIPASADALFREVLGALSPNDAAKITIPAPLPEIFADPVQLREVFTELLDNALKFTSKTAEPRIDMRATVEPDAVRISVRDNGIGFDPKHAAKIFQVFHRLHTPAEYPGNGIGLAIVQRVVQAHGGCAESESTPGQGATFSFTLPREPRESSGNGSPK